MPNKTILNKEQSHILQDFFRRYGEEQVWKIDSAIIALVQEILAADDATKSVSEPNAEVN